MVTSVTPIVWPTVAAGLGSGSLIADCPAAFSAARKRAVPIAMFFMPAILERARRPFLYRSCNVQRTGMRVKTREPQTRRPLQDLLHCLRRPPHHRPPAADDDWPLDEDRMLDHRAQHLVVGCGVVEAERLVLRLAAPHDIDRANAEQLYDPAQF